MKTFRTYFMLTIASSLAFVSCNDKGTKNGGSNDADSTEVVVKGDPSLVSSQEVLDELKSNDKDDNKYSVEDFFRNPEKSSYQISPDGNSISFLAPVDSRMNLFVEGVGSDDAKQITHETDRDIAGYFWANNNRLLYIKDFGGDENYHLFAVDADGENLSDLTPFDSITLQIIDQLEDMPDELIIGMNKRNKMIFDPYRLNIETGEMTMLYENPGNVTGYLTDHEGKLRITVTTDGVNSTLRYRETEADDFNDILTTDFRETLDPVFFSFDNKNVYALSNLGRDKTAAILFDLKTGKESGDVIASNPDVDITGLSYSRKRKVLTAASYTLEKRERIFLDDLSKNIYEHLQQALPGYEIAVTSANKAEDKLLVRTYSDRSLGAYYFYDVNTEELRKITDVSDWIDENDMSPMTPVKYTSRDGMTIHGYLTIPKNSDGKNLPVVIYPHGGPWYRDSWGYQGPVQLMASRGIAVFQMNFRGSTGYGRAFWEASFKQWGKTMQDDITDGVKWLIDQGIADPKHIGIHGGSYGGYATLAGVTYTPNLYACAVDYVGVSNLFTFMSTIPPYWKPFLDMMYEMVGNPNIESDSLLMATASPAMHIDQIKTPLFIAQGANDPRVNINESDQVVKALRERNIDVPYMVKYDEGHGFHNEENRIDFYKTMIGFLTKYLK